MRIITVAVGGLQTNCYLVISENNSAMMIDPGAESAKLLDLLKEEGVRLEYIVLTHGHYDHIGVLDKIKQETGAQVLIHWQDEEMLTDPEKSLAAYFSRENFRVRADRLLQDGDNIVLDELNFTVLHTPGHTKGSITLMGHGVLFTGDTLFADGIGRTDLYGGDFPTLCNSLKRLAGLEGDFQVFSGHGEETTLGRERRDNFYLSSVGQQ